MAVHCPFGLASRARCIDQVGQVLRLDPVYRIAGGFLANACPRAIYGNHLSNVSGEACAQALLDQEQRHLRVLQQEG